jgi:hypothetical protein
MRFYAFIVPLMTVTCPINLNFLTLNYPLISKQNWGRSVSIVLTTDRTTRVRSPADTKSFSSSLCVQTALRPTQPRIQWVPEVLSPGVKRGRGVTLTTHPI